MAKNTLIFKIVNSIFKIALAVEENKSREIPAPKKILIVRQHNQLGDLLSGVSLFRALKETYSDTHITLIVSPFNYPGIIKNKYVDRFFIFDKKKLVNPAYFNRFHKLLKENYDLTIVPVVVAISFTSNLIARLSNSKTRIGPESLDGEINQSAYFFDRRVKLDWTNHPDSNVAERSLDIVRPFGINTDNYKPEITFDSGDDEKTDEYTKANNFKDKEYLIGLHIGAGKPPNRWSLEKYAKLISRLNRDFDANFYLTGSDADREDIKLLKSKIDFEVGEFMNRSIPEVASLISKSSLFISNDTGIMHVAGSTDTPQISVFGPTNPFNWAPCGANKFFIRKSELIEDIAVDDVYQLCTIILNKVEA
jgi:ADP-heptose:LPS heptosyltransferase